MLPETETRRGFLKTGLGIMGVGMGLPGYLVQTALAAPQAAGGERIMVVLQLNGGHDGLSELVPYGHKEYAEARKVTRIADAEVLKINDELGLHPNLKGFQALLKEGAFAAVPGVGYPNPNYSHFTSTDIWHMADPRGRALPHGWLGRACDQAFKGKSDPKLSVAVGSNRAPLALVGREYPGISFNDPESFKYTGDRGDARLMSAYKDLNMEAPESCPSESLKFVTTAAGAANASSEQIREAVKAYKSKVEYPKSGLGRNLRTIAGLICSGMSTRIYYTFQGGYDTHEGQRVKHDKLMIELNDAITAFQADLALQGQAKRVLTFTTSEFGRRVKENGSDGTDHGAAASLFLFGPAVKAGICGKHPSLSDLIGGGGGSLKHQVDFRSVYATILEKWMGIPAAPILGQAFPLLECIA